ncbi:MAG: Cgl0159 family (beta/alpha)8-fold protein [Longimicrobiales bacterium]
MDDSRFRALLETRARNPEKILKAACTRRRRPLLGDDGRAHTISALARARIVAMFEPLPVRRAADGTLSVAKDADALIRAACVAAGLGVSSAYTSLKIPVVEEMERVVAATTLPTLLLGGDPGDRAAEVFAGWKRALEFPQVRGLVAGRALLFPEDGDVATAVGTAAALVQG